MVCQPRAFYLSVMILSDIAIRLAIDNGDIVITPFHERCLGPNSYDVHLAGEVSYPNNMWEDPLRPQHTTPKHIPENGLLLSPGTFLHGCTIERTRTRNYVPFLEGKSSIGRLGLAVHVTAGVGDHGFTGHWTLEMFAIKPVRIYKGMPIGQLIYHQLLKPGGTSYAERGTYNNRQRKPAASNIHTKQYWRELFKDVGNE